MPLNKIAFVPGVDKQNSEYGAEGRWVDSDFVRFRYGLPEKIGGWNKFSADIFPGPCTKIISWGANSGAPLLAAGTNRKLYINYTNIFYDITPIRATVPAQLLTPTNGTTELTITDPSHGAAVGDIVRLSSISGPVGGVAATTMTGQYQVKTVPTLSTFTVESPETFSSSVTATATITYDFNSNSALALFDYGWGTGVWGQSTWGTPRPQSAALSTIPGLWSLDNYGEDLIGIYAGGGVYYWDFSLGANLPATVLTNAPTKNTLGLVSDERFVILCGTEEIIGDPASFDPMLVRFSVQEDPNDWEPTSTNTAGAQRLTDGTRIVAAKRSRGQVLIWTDTSLHGMQYVGPPYTYGINQLGANCGAVGPSAAVDINGVAFWMGTSSFFIFDGVVRKLPCTVEDYVFSTLDFAQSFPVTASANTQFNEVTWFYATTTGVWAYVTFNYLENCWVTGSMSRTAWQDRGTFPFPIAADYLPNEASTLPVVYGLSDGTSILYNQETGTDADGLPINSYITSGYFDIGDGDNVLFIRRVIPDFKYQTGDVEFNVLTRLYPSSSAEPSSLDPYTITPTTEKIDTRIRGRQVSINLENNSLGGDWRFGTLRIDVQPDGLR